MIPTHRYYKKIDLIPLMKKHRKRPVIVLDLETNGLRPGNSILSCSAVKLVLDSKSPGTAGEKEGPLRRLGVFDRYYFSEEEENLSALRVNGLFREVIEHRRGENGWPEFFREDLEFRNFCEDAGLFVAHNIDFDVQFLPFLEGRDQFCTMKSNTVGKFPKLAELASLYGIEAKTEALHGSLYDTELTVRIFQKMVEEILPEVEQGDLLF